LKSLVKTAAAWALINLSGWGCRAVQSRRLHVPERTLPVNISSVATAPPKTVPPSEARESAAVADHDGDADDGVQAVATKAPPAPETGNVVDKTA